MQIILKKTKADYLCKPIGFLLLLVFAFLPYDAIPFLPSTYRPLSLIPLILIIPFAIPLIIRKSPSKATKYLLAFYFLSNLFSIVSDVCINNKLKNFLDYFFTSTIGLILFVVCDTIFYYYSNSRNYKTKFSKTIAYSYIFPIIIAFLDLLSIYNFIPNSISTTIHSIFGGNQSSRVCGFTLEASWLTMHLLFCLPAFYYLLKKKLIKKWFALFPILDVIVIVFTFSMQAFVYVFLSLILIWIYKLKNDFSFKLLLLPPVFLLAILLLINSFSLINSNSYFINRFKNLNLNYLLHNDSSVFIRIINPTISLLMWFDHPVLGIGGGMYPIYYSYYINKYFSWALSFYNGSNEIVETISSLSANSKCLYTRVLGEFGFVGFLFYNFLFSIVRSHNHCHCKSNKYFVYWLFVCLILLLQFDSFCFFPVLIYLAFYNNIKKSRKCIFQ